MFHTIKSAFEEISDESIIEEKPIMANKSPVSDNLNKNFSLIESFSGDHHG
jgi:hypothetical protein